MELATCDKYYDKVLEKFPKLTKKQVDKIVKHGLSSLYMLNLYGGDVLLKSGNWVMYFGKLFHDNLVFYKYWRIKWKIKLRINYKRAKKQYDGYYYFGLTENQFQAYKAQIKSRGSKRKSFHFELLLLYKILEECELDHAHKYFFRMKYPEDCGFVMMKRDYDARNIEYISRRNSDKIIEPVSYEGNRDKCVKRRSK